jgi:hypothetical protein
VANGCAWLDYHSVRHLTAVDDYLQLNGANNIAELAKGKLLSERELKVKYFDIALAGLGSIKWGPNAGRNDSHSIPTNPSKKSCPVHFPDMCTNLPSSYIPGAGNNTCHLANHQIMRYLEGTGPALLNFPRNFSCGRGRTMESTSSG